MLLIAIVQTEHVNILYLILIEIDDVIYKKCIEFLRSSLNTTILSFTYITHHNRSIFIFESFYQLIFLILRGYKCHRNFTFAKFLYYCK